VAAPAAAPVEATAPAVGEWHVALGDLFDDSTTVPVDQIVASPATWDGKDVVVDGVVKEVCQQKGCWRTIATAGPQASVMVKDEEYEIFLPEDAAGKKVYLKGTFAVAVLPESEARHYAEDAGRHPSTSLGPQKTFAIDVAGARFVEG